MPIMSFSKNTKMRKTGKINKRGRNLFSIVIFCGVCVTLRETHLFQPQGREERKVGTLNNILWCFTVHKSEQEMVERHKTSLVFRISEATISNIGTRRLKLRKDGIFSILQARSALLSIRTKKRIFTCIYEGAFVQAGVRDRRVDLPQHSGQFLPIPVSAGAGNRQGARAAFPQQRRDPLSVTTFLFPAFENNAYRTRKTLRHFGASRAVKVRILCLKSFSLLLKPLGKTEKKRQKKSTLHFVK